MTAPMRDENQLHAAIVEIVANERAEVKFLPYRTGIRVIRKVKAVSITS